MAGEREFEEGSAAGGVPRPAGTVPGWDLDVDEPEDREYLSRDFDELGLVDPMSPEEFAYLGSPDVRWVQPPRFDPALFEPLPGTEDVCQCACGHAHQPPSTGQEPLADQEPPAADGAAAAGDAEAGNGGAAGGGDPAGLPSPRRRWRGPGSSAPRRSWTRSRPSRPPRPASTQTGSSCSPRSPGPRAPPARPGWTGWTPPPSPPPRPPPRSSCPSAPPAPWSRRPSP